MIQVYADDSLVYDSRLEECDLEGLMTTTGLNVGGKAEITMPVGHPAYNRFVGYRTVVTIFRDDKLRFRGRALYPTDDFFGSRTITCEGEMCFLRDGISRPYLYQDSPANIFSAVIGKYNEQVDDFKQFKVGEITVLDDDYIRLVSESAETVLDTVNKLLERCGGYLVFTTDEDGDRTINWYAATDYTNNQVIEFGENLLDFTSTGANTTLATGLIPYGAINNDTGTRVTIESVNNGLDYIMADDAKDIRGIIMATATWDDVTEPANLLTKARAYLEQCKVIVTSLTLTALDLSYMDKDMDSFTVGDLIRVKSVPHGVNEVFQLTQMTENMLRPAENSITLGKDLKSLTGADVAGDRQGISQNEATKVLLRSEVKQSMSNTREAFANDATDVIISEGTVTFNSGTIIMQGTNFSVDKNGLLKAKKAEIEGTVTTEAGLYKSILSSGQLQFIYDSTKLGSLAPSIYTEDTSKYGVAVRMEKETAFVSFCRYSDDDGKYNPDYIINYGMDPDGVTERHIFYGAVRYVNDAYFGGHAIFERSGVVVLADQRKTTSVEELPEAYATVIDQITPVRFKYTDDQSGRYHVGFTAQDVQAALETAGLTTQDFGGFADVSGDGETLGLAYDEFVGLLCMKIRQLEQRIEALTTT